MKLQFSHKENIANNIWKFYFLAPQPFSFTPGQFIELTIPHINSDDRDQSRCFTISSTPKDKYITIITRIFDQKSTFKQKLIDLNKNDEINYTGPMGDFVLPKIIETPIVFIAGGIGITPFVSIIQYLYQNDEQRKIHLLWALNNENDIFETEGLNKYDFKKTLIVKNPSEFWGGERGDLSLEMILNLTSINDQTQFYISGPEKMVESLTHQLKENFKDKHQIISDYFPGYINY